MHLCEISDVLKTLVILVDTREQDTELFRKRISKFRFPVERIALDSGDYGAKVQLPTGEWHEIAAVVERKMNIDELCMCFGRERDRFARELQRAQDAQKRVYLLVEGASWENILAGKYRSLMHKNALLSTLLIWEARYDYKIIMCDNLTTGKMINDILYSEAVSELEKMADE